MLGHADRARLVAKIVPQDPRCTAYKDLRLPTWSDEERLARRHSRRGRDCDKASQNGLTKTVPWIGASTARYEFEVCPCDGHRQVIDGVPDREWIGINGHFVGSMS